MRDAIHPKEAVFQRRAKQTEQIKDKKETLKMYQSFSYVDPDLILKIEERLVFQSEQTEQTMEEATGEDKP